MQEQAVVSAPIGAGEGLVEVVVASMGALSNCSDDQNGRGSEQEPEDVPIRLDQVEGESVAPAWDGDIGPLDALLDGAAGGPTLGTGPAGEMGGPTVRELPRAVPRAAPGAPPRSLIVRRGVDVGLESLPAAASKSTTPTSVTTRCSCEYRLHAPARCIPPGRVLPRCTNLVVSARLEAPRRGCPGAGCWTPRDPFEPAGGFCRAWRVRPAPAGISSSTRYWANSSTRRLGGAGAPTGSCPVGLPRGQKTHVGGGAPES